jgi:hypothetical protein
MSLRQLQCRSNDVRGVYALPSYDGQLIFPGSAPSTRDWTDEEARVRLSRPWLIAAGLASAAFGPEAAAPPRLYGSS